VTAQVGDPGGPEMREERIGCNEQQREEVRRHSDTSHRARLSSNKVGDVEGAGSNRSGDRNKNKAGNVKATGKEQDSGHFTEDKQDKRRKKLVPRS